jgi:hypothetical protein
MTVRPICLMSFPAVRLSKTTFHFCPAWKLSWKRVMGSPGTAMFGMTVAGSGGGFKHPHDACARWGWLNREKLMRKEAKVTVHKNSPFRRMSTYLRCRMLWEHSPREVLRNPAALQPYPVCAGRRPVALRSTLSSGLPFSGCTLWCYFLCMTEDSLGLIGLRGNGDGISYRFEKRTSIIFPVCCLSPPLSKIYRPRAWEL